MSSTRQGTTIYFSSALSRRLKLHAIDRKTSVTALVERYAAEGIERDTASQTTGPASSPPPRSAREASVRTAGPVPIPPAQEDQ